MNANQSLTAASGSANTQPAWLNVLNGVTQAAGNVATIFRNETPQPTQVVVKQLAEEKAAQELSAAPVMNRNRWLWVAAAGVGLVGLFYLIAKNR